MTSKQVYINALTNMKHEINEDTVSWVVTL